MKNNVIYEGLRKQAFDTLPNDIGVVLDDNSQVYAAIVDLSVGDNVATMYCSFDGTVSLYYSTGKVDVGLGKTESIRKAAMSFLFSSGQCLKAMDKVEDCRLPQKGETNIYLKANEGIYIATIKNGEKPIKEHNFLNMLVQMTISEINKNTGLEFH